MQIPASLSDLVSSLPGYDPDALPVEKAQQIIREFVAPIQESEQLALPDALGRVLAQDIVSPIDVPQQDNAAMDGYAVRGIDLDPALAVTLAIAGSALAGSPFDAGIAPGQCVRIMTGATMPAGCDTVVPQELVQATGKTVTIPPGAVRTGDNRRRRGEDLQADKAALKQGKILRPAELGLLASLGLGTVPVRRKLRVAFFSTGDELCSVGEPLAPGCVYDSNRYTLLGMLTRLGCEPIDIGVVKDDPAALEAALRRACENADAVITSGGVSVGEADYTKQIMARLGDTAFWKINMRPGRPLAFGRIASNGREACLFGLPGNPVATMIAFHFFVREALLRMMGAQTAPLPLVQAISPVPIRKRPGRTEYQRGMLSHDENGRLQVMLTGAQGSGMLSSMSNAHCIVVLGDAQEKVEAGDTVNVILFDGLV